MREGMELPDISVLRQLCRAELAARLDSVSTIAYSYFSYFGLMLAACILFRLPKVFRCHAH